MSTLVIKELDVADLTASISLWWEVGLTIGASDTIPELELFISLNPTTSLVGWLDDQLVATVLGGFDGRRGLVHHLAVASIHQGKGFGRVMMEELDRRYQAMGVVKYSFWIEPRNQKVIEFYRHLGYEMRDLITISKTLRS